MSQLSKNLLLDLYVDQKKSVPKISTILNCSENKINYWLAKHEIKKRSISDALYNYKNPFGDPFLISTPKTLKEGILFGLGIGLYWGEGSKKGSGGIRLTNSDPKLIRKFIEFLEKNFCIGKSKLRFSLQLFGDLDKDAELLYWSNQLSVKKNQFYKIIVSQIRGKGTYKNKSKHGVVIVYFNNIKSKRLLCEMIEKIG